ncbi:unnamed protein product [Linum trigynum]|uniref:Uncharacterized protein n=1 Tax=Linum trigynum TaxID=586398 RepID=A0AAV2FBQ4_9ROSI
MKERRRCRTNDDDVDSARDEDNGREVDWLATTVTWKGRRWRELRSEQPLLTTATMMIQRRRDANDDDDKRNGGALRPLTTAFTQHPTTGFDDGQR